ncbi:hypothetical protein [Promicromonospora aerolata]|uniref:Uncharacterized protein n=1 Tax=Promicromonospora aerolata TaxID=195749 RepID=A0ABW4VBL4_9MICO
MTVPTSAEADNPTRWTLSTRVPDDWVDLSGFVYQAAEYEPASGPPTNGASAPPSEA